MRLAEDTPTARVATAIRHVTPINAIDSEATVSAALVRMTPVAFAVRSKANTSGRRCGGASVSSTRE